MFNYPVLRHTLVPPPYGLAQLRESYSLRKPKQPHPASPGGFQDVTCTQSTVASVGVVLHLRKHAGVLPTCWSSVIVPVDLTIRSRLSRRGPRVSARPILRLPR